MPDGFNEMLRSWQNFYFMTGGAAAALVGLMFVAVSLGMPYVSDTTREDMHTFVTPSIFYFVSVLLLSCVMLVPAYTPPLLALITFLGGGLGLGWTVQYVRKLIGAANQHQDFNRADWLAQVILPVLSYGLILMAAIGVAVNQWPLAFMGLWLAAVLLLICATANTWSLVLWIMEQRNR